MNNLNSKNFNKAALEQQLINKVGIIKNKIRILNAKKMNTNLLYEKKEYSIRIQNLEYELNNIKDILVNKIQSKKTITSLIKSNKKDVKEIDFLIKNVKLSDKDYMYLISKKMDLNIFTFEISKNLKNSENTYLNQPIININKELSLNDLKELLLNKSDFEISEIIKSIPQDVVTRIWGNISPTTIEVKEVIKEVPVEVQPKKLTARHLKEMLLNKPDYEIFEIIKDIPESIVSRIWGNISPLEIREIIKEIPVEVVKEVPVEVIKEIPVEVVKEIQVEGEPRELTLNDLKEMLLNKPDYEIFEIIKDIPEDIVTKIWGNFSTTEIKEIVKEVEKEIIKEVPVEVIKEVEKEIIKEVPVEVIKEVEKEIIKEVPVEIIKEAPPITVYREVTVPIEVMKEVKIFVGPDGNLYDDEGRTRRLDMALTDEMLNNMGANLYQEQVPVVFDDSLENKDEYLEEYLSHEKDNSNAMRQQLSDTVDYANNPEIVTMDDADKLYRNNQAYNEVPNQVTINREALEEDNDPNDLNFDNMNFDLTDM